MRVKHWKRLTHGMSSDRVKMSCPNALVAIFVGDDIDQLAIGRPDLRFAILHRGNPISLRNWHFIETCDVRMRALIDNLELEPSAVGREGIRSNPVLGVEQFALTS